MKKYLIISCEFVFLLFLLFTLDGCDEFNSLPLNIPFSINVTVAGTGSTISESADYCFSTQSDTYNEYKDKVTSLHFVEAAFRTIGVNPTDLTGDLVITLIGNGNTLFTYTIQGYKPADYQKPNMPYILKLDQQQIDFINAYLDDILNNSEGSCFNATITVNNVVNGGQPSTLNAALDMVIEADTRL
jgi:hypothetical protein